MKHLTLSSNYRRVVCFLGMALFAYLFIFQPSALAQTFSGSSVFTPPTTGGGLLKGGTEIAGIVFMILKIIAVILVGVGCLKLYNGDTGQGIWACIAALLAFLAPTLVEMAIKIGQMASSSS